MKEPPSPAGLPPNPNEMTLPDLPLPALTQPPRLQLRGRKQARRGRFFITGTYAKARIETNPPMGPLVQGINKQLAAGRRQLFFTACSRTVAEQAYGIFSPGP